MPYGTICGTLNFTAPKEQLHYAKGITSLRLAATSLDDIHAVTRDLERDFSKIAARQLNCFCIYTDPFSIFLRVEGFELPKASLTEESFTKIIWKRLKH